MCGIFGGIALSNPQDTLTKMSAALMHRGPDDHGMYINGALSFGHLRLSIIDLAGGHQPMFSSDYKHVIVYNGEIYNFKEVRELLKARGHVFSTNSDTEVILAAYREWGYECLDKLNGMFAFALWDEQTRKLWLVRDRIGKKPLYYTTIDKTFYFASEAKALWSVPGFKRDFDIRALDYYMTFRYVPGTRTFFKNITKLAAGHWMLVDETGKISKQKQWWDVPQRSNTTISLDPHSISDNFLALFKQAAQSRLIADVPVALLLSSGIDSASIACEIAEVSKPNFISVGFGEKTDELSHAARLAKELGGNHFPFTIHERDFDLFHKAVRAMDEPYGDPIILPTYLLAKKAAEHVKVVLTGDGGDETLGSYIHHLYFRSPISSMAPSARVPLALLAKACPISMLNTFFHYPSSMGKLGKDRMVQLFGQGNNLDDVYMNFASLFNDTEKQQLYTPALSDQLKHEPDEIRDAMRAHFSNNQLTPLDRVLWWDLKHWFPEQTLMKLDRLSMAHSIEGRCPYADHRLIEFLFTISYNYYNLITKHKQIVRHAYGKQAPYLPSKKQAFYFPLHNIFHDRSERLLKSVLKPDNVKKSGWLNYDYVQSLLRDRTHSPLLADKRLMNLTILLLWLENHQ